MKKCRNFDRTNMFGVNLGTMKLKETIALHWTKSKTKLDIDYGGLESLSLVLVPMA